jgi:DNA excision repair protein ERCC-3
MGRILRAKRRNEEGFKSRFFTLVSKDTDEVGFSVKRKKFLIDQGYEYKVYPDVSDLIPKDSISKLHYSQTKDQAELLQQVMEQTEEAGENETISADIDDLNGVIQKKKPDRRVNHNPEEKTKKEKEKERNKKRNILFRQWSK